MNSKQDPYFNSLRNKLFQSQESPKEELWDKISLRLNRGVKRKKSLFYLSLILLISPLWFNITLSKKGIFKEVVLAKSEQDISETKRDLIAPQKNGRASNYTLNVDGTVNKKSSGGMPPMVRYNRMVLNEKAPKNAATGFPETIHNLTVVSHFQSNEDSIMKPPFSRNFSARNPLTVPLTLSLNSQPKLLCVNLKDIKTKQSFLVSHPWEIALDARFASNSMKLEPQNAWKAKSLLSLSSDIGLHISHQLFKFVNLQSGLELENLGFTAQIHQTNVPIDTISGKISLNTPFDALDIYQSNLVNPSVGQGEEDEELELEVEDSVIASLDFTSASKINLVRIPLNLEVRIPIQKFQVFVNSGVNLALVKNATTEIQLLGFSSPKYMLHQNLKRHFLSTQIAAGFIVPLNNSMAISSGLTYQGSLGSLTTHFNAIRNTHSLGFNVGLKYSF